jgi:hypothetical protein
MSQRRRTPDPQYSPFARSVFSICRSVIFRYVPATNSCNIGTPQKSPTKAQRGDKQMDDAAITVARTLSKAATGKIPMFGPFGGPTVNYLFANVFASTDGPTSYLGDVHKRVNQIATPRMDEATSKRVDGAIHRALISLRDYEPSKHESNLSNMDHRKRLHDHLSGILRAFRVNRDGMMQLVDMQTPPPASAFSVYLAGVSIIITLYQELAIVDPGQRSPREAGRSQYGKQSEGNVILHARNGIDFATRIWNEIKAKRKQAISVGEGTFVWRRRLYDDLSMTHNFREFYEPMWKFLPKNDPDYFLAQAWENYVGPIGKKTDPAPPEMDFNAVAKRAIENYYNTRAVPELINEVGDPDQIMKEWTFLTTWPLPLPN